MTRGTLIMRWINRQLRNWWPLLAALVGGAILATLAMVVTKVDDDREELRAQRDLLAEQSEHLRDLLEADQRREEESDEAFNAAIGEVRALMDELFAAHDENGAVKLNELLHQIAALLGRPAGVPVDPVTAQPLAPAPTPSTAPDRSSSAPTTTTPTRTTTTTTTPDQRSCHRRPSGPRC